MLKEDSLRFGRPKKQKALKERKVRAFVQNIHCAQDVQVAGFQPRGEILSGSNRRCGEINLGWDVGIAKTAGNPLRVIMRAAERDCRFTLCMFPPFFNDRLISFGDYTRAFSRSFMP